MLIAFLIGVGIACALTTILAVVMVIADATIANYGEVTIVVNDDREFLVEGGKPLLGTLKDQQVFVPSSCGGRGSCGLCKVEVTSGAGDFLPTELPWLSEDEKARNVRLSCQLKVKQDFRIHIPEELFDVRQFTAEVASVKDLTHDIKEFVFKLLDPPELEAEAGQYIQFEVPPYELTDEPVYRAYSIASQPSRKDEIELQVRLVPYGICTTYMFKYLKIGDAVSFNGPYGDFVLSDTGREIVFVAGGTGMAPVKSILFDMLEKGNTRRTRYFFGANAPEDLFLVEEMAKLEKELYDFTFIPSVCEASADNEFVCERGLITEIVEAQVKQGEDVEAYLCGSPAMIDACVKILASKGVPEEQVFYDKFE